MPTVARKLPPPTPRTDGAIYQAGQQMELFADLKARRIGDVLTIVLNESTNASQDRDHHDVEGDDRREHRAPRSSAGRITTKGVPIFDTTLTGADSFAGEGASAQSNSLAGQPDRDRGRRPRPTATWWCRATRP